MKEREVEMSFQLLRPNWSKKRRSLRSEKSAARLIGGRRQPGSGAVPVAALKADAKSKDWLLEDKTTLANGYRFTRGQWHQLRNQAFRANRKPVFRISFEGGPVLIVLDESTFEELLRHEP
jgi:hypothetical protein